MNLVKVHNKSNREIYVNVDHIDFMEDTGQGFWKVVVRGQTLDLYYDWIKEIIRVSPVAKKAESKT